MADAEAIQSARGNAQVPVLVNYSRRWDSACVTVAARLRSGELGRVRRITGAYSGSLRDNGSHLFDLIHWWHGPIRTVEAVRRRESGSPDLTLCSQDGVLVDLIALADTSFSVLELVVYTDRARVELADSGFSVCVQEAEGFKLIPGVTVLGPRQAIHAGLEHGFERCLDNIAATMRGSSDPACTVDDGVAVVRVTEAVLEAPGW